MTHTQTVGPVVDQSSKLPSPLSDELLARCAERAPGYDRENRFCSEDFEELCSAGYLNLAVPCEFGGLGFSLGEVCREQRRLAYHAAPTALAVNMHFYWTGVFADVWRTGDRSVEGLLHEAAAGEVFAAGHSESGNDLSLLWSTVQAERADGGYRITGRKSFGSLAPVWTRLGLHALDSSDPNAPQVVHAFLPRDTPGWHPVETWDALGMRATRSDDTVLEGTFVPDRYIARVVPAGTAGIDRFVLSVYAGALLGFANVYFGLARRVYDLVLDYVPRRHTAGLSRSLAYHPEVQHGVAEMAIELEAIEAHLDRVAQDWSDGVDHGRLWGLKLAAAKFHAVEGSWRVVDQGMELAGGAGMFTRGPFERLWRDARLGRVHPTNAMATHENVAKAALGINRDERPRWG